MTRGLVNTVFYSFLLSSNDVIPTVEKDLLFANYYGYIIILIINYNRFYFQKLYKNNY